MGAAAEMLGVSVDTVRRWADAGRIAVTRSSTGERLLDRRDVQRLAAERRQIDAGAGRRAEGTTASSARNRFAGEVTRIERDRVAAVVEVQAGPHRLVSLMTAEAVIEMGLEVGDEVVCVVKATNVIVDRLA
jgi:molybdopterin-binding protein